MGRSDVFLRLEIIKKSYGLVILAVSIFCFQNVYVVAAGSVLSTLIATFVNALPNQKLLGYRYVEQVRDLLPSLVMTVVMGLCVWAVGQLTLGSFPMLLLQAVTGIGVYAALSLWIKPKAFTQMRSMLATLRAPVGSIEEDL